MTESEINKEITFKEKNEVFCEWIYALSKTNFVKTKTDFLLLTSVTFFDRKDRLKFIFKLIKSLRV